MPSSTFTWIGGTAEATGADASPSNWSPTGTPGPGDTIVMSSGDMRFAIATVLHVNTAATIDFGGGTIAFFNAGTDATASGLDATSLIDATGTTELDTSGGFTNAGTIAAEIGGALTIKADATAGFFNTGTIIADSGFIAFSGALGDTAGYWGLINAGTIELNSTVIASTETFDFIDGSQDVLMLDQPANFHGDIFEFDVGNTIDLGVLNIGTLIYDSTDHLTLENPGGTVLAKWLMSPFPHFHYQQGTFALDAEGNAGSFHIATALNGDAILTGGAQPPCFVAGTRIATEAGDAAIEDLRIGDRVRTVLDDTSASIIWIGHRVIDCTRHRKPEQVWPVRIAADAFGIGMPQRDLFLSPDHALYLHDVLIPVKYLIDGRSITQVKLPHVAYYHLELSRHNVVLANGLPAETYLPQADQGGFFDRTGPAALHPDLSSRVWEAEGCAPLVVTGPTLNAVRRSINAMPRPRKAVRHLRRA